nr:unnamed protein product [Digitaria exilis]
MSAGEERACIGRSADEEERAPGRDVRWPSGRRRRAGLQQVVLEGRRVGLQQVVLEGRRAGLRQVVLEGRRAGLRQVRGAGPGGVQV